MENGSSRYADASLGTRYLGTRLFFHHVGIVRSNENGPLAKANPSRRLKPRTVTEVAENEQRQLVYSAGADERAALNAGKFRAEGSVPGERSACFDNLSTSNLPRPRWSSANGIDQATRNARG